MGAPMFGLLDFQIEPLHRILGYELATIPDEARDKIFEVLDSCFQLWKVQHGKKEANPLGGALLGTHDKPFEELEPWQCAGFGIFCRTDLAFKLWLENYEPFKLLVDRIGVARIFAVLASREQPVHAPAIIRVVGLLVDTFYERYFKMFDLADKQIQDGLRREQIKRQSLAMGRPRGTETIKARAQQRHRALRDYARSVFQQYPSRSYDEVAKELLNKPYAVGEDGHRYKQRTIRDIIKGTRKEAHAARESRAKS